MNVSHTVVVVVVVVVLPITCHEGTEGEQMYSSAQS
jgi:hypothetical protein